MTALRDFIVYLAQAHGCRRIVSVAPTEQQRNPLYRCEGRTFGNANPDPAAGLRLLTDSACNGTAALVTCCVQARCKGALPNETLAAVRHAMQSAAVGVLAITAPVVLSPADVQTALADHGLHVAFIGRAPRLEGLLTVLQPHPAVASTADQAPRDFRVLAIVPVRNEEDVIAQTVRDLIAQGLDVHLIDNWSTDSTVERASPFLGRGLIAIERFPCGGPSATYDLAAIMSRVEDIAAESRWATWVVLHDADERRRSPWPGVALRDAFWRVDRSGFTCVDHVTLNFWPTDDSFDPAGPDLEEQFPYFSFSDHPGHFHQRRAWKQCGTRVALAASAGHDCTFPGRRVYPYKFLLKHYPIRSQAHGERKLLHDRRPRWNRQERARGWHRQYDDIEHGRFLRDPLSLTRFDAQSFSDEFLLQRLSGAGVFAEPPAWATPPRW